MRHYIKAYRNQNFMVTVYKFKKIRGMTDFSDQLEKLQCVTNVLAII